MGPGPLVPERDDEELCISIEIDLDIDIELRRGQA
jgi:hypothetical protein